MEKNTKVPQLQKINADGRTK